MRSRKHIERDAILSTLQLDPLNVFKNDEQRDDIFHENIWLV